MQASPDIGALRARLRAIDSPGGRCGQRLSFGSAEADRVLGETLVCGRMHEIGGPAATLFAALVLTRSEGGVLWCAHQGAPSAVYPPGLAQVGLDPARLVLVRLARAPDLLHAAHEGLRAGWHVLLEAARPLDLSGARRLQLACEAGGGLGLAVAPGRTDDAPLLPSAATRWSASAANGALWPRAARLHLHLLRNRSGLPGRWTMEWDYAPRSFSLVSQPCDRQGDAPRAVSA